MTVCSKTKKGICHSKFSGNFQIFEEIECHLAPTLCLLRSSDFFPGFRHSSSYWQFTWVQLTLETLQLNINSAAKCGKMFHMGVFKWFIVFFGGRRELRGVWVRHWHKHLKDLSGTKIIYTRFTLEHLAFTQWNTRQKSCSICLPPLSRNTGLAFDIWWGITVLKSQMGFSIMGCRHPT